MGGCMTKTELRVKLTKAVNSARDLKVHGLTTGNYKYEWNDSHLLATAQDLRAAAKAIDEYVFDKQRKAS